MKKLAIIFPESKEVHAYIVDATGHVIDYLGWAKGDIKILVSMSCNCWLIDVINDYGDELETKGLNLVIDGDYVLKIEWSLMEKRFYRGKQKMSSGKLEAIYKEGNDESQNFKLELQSDFSSIVIPFSKIFKRNNTALVPIEEREYTFQEILKQEFSTL